MTDKRLHLKAPEEGAMSTTVEALEEAQSWLNECSVNPPLREKLRAAIPRAELEGQAVELMPRVLQALRTAIELIEQEMP